MKHSLADREFHVAHDYINDAIHSQSNWAILLCDVIPDGKTE